MVEAVRLAVAVQPGLLRRLQQAVRADDIGSHEGIRAGDRAVDVAFRREVDDRVDLVIGNDRRDQIGIADIAFDEEHVVQPVEVVLVACIGQQVEDDDLVLGCDLAAIMDEVGANEARAAGDNQISHGS